MCSTQFHVRSFFSVGIVAALLSLQPCLTLRCLAQNAPTADQIRQSIATAGNEYRAGKIDEAVKLLNRSTAQIQQLANEAENTKVLANLKILHGGLAKAYQRLELDGVELDPLPAWGKIVEAASANTKPDNKGTKNGPKMAGEQVNFVTDIAPWLVSKCSKCHINDPVKGGFSMKTLAELMKGSKAGKVVFAKDVSASRIVEVIESGDMPRGGSKVGAADLDKLKKWIEQGCVFDSKSVATPLISLAGGESKIDPKDRDVASMVHQPTGKETVSFTKDVVPLLLANCKGCHIDARQLRGELNMDSFVKLLKGGENGSIIQAKKSEESLLIKKLKGTAGDRMPAGGKAAFKPEQIQLIAKWIDEGAAFDGYSANADIEEVASRAWAASASNEELMKRRQERALEKWSKVFPTQEPVQANEGEFVVLGNVGQRGVDEILASTRTAMERVLKGLKLHEHDPLAKGGVTIFVIKGRYDYSEFGKMAESRSLPNQWTGHWRREVLDVYVTILYDEKDPKANEANLTQQLASLWVSTNKETPNWFSNGFGRAVLAMIAGRNEPKVKAWDQQIPSIVGNMKSPKELLDGKMNEEDAAIVGYGLVRKMIDSSGRKTFDQFLRSLDATHDFEKAFTLAVGPIEPAVGTILGLRPNSTKKR